VATDDDELRKLERDVVEIRNRPARLGRTKRSRVADLEAEWDAELDRFGVQRLIAPIVRWQIPEPGHDAERPEAELADAAA